MDSALRTHRHVTSPVESSLILTLPTAPATQSLSSFGFPKPGVHRCVVLLLA